MSSELLLAVVVEMRAGAAEEGRRYEDGVLALLDRHGGRLERRVRSVDGATEVHLIRFADAGGMDSFMVDPERLALREKVGDAAPVARVLTVHDVDHR